LAVTCLEGNGKQKLLAIILRYCYGNGNRPTLFIAMKTKIFQLAVVLVGVFLSSISVFADPLNNWHWRNPLPSGNPPPSGLYWLSGIVFANGQFFAVGDNGNELISTNGTSGIESATATTNQLNDIIYANGQFLALGNNGALETSTTGTNWVLRYSGTTNSLTSAAYANGKYVAVGGGSIISSPDGVTWSPVTAGLGGAGVVAGSSIGFVAVSGGTSSFPIHGGIIQSGGPQCYFSQNGMTWTTNVLTYPGSGSPLTAGYVGFANGKFLVAAYSSPGPNAVDLFVFTSSDGQNWTSNSVATRMPDEGGGLDYTCFMSGPNVVLSGEIEVPFVLSSPDEVNWSFQESHPNDSFQGYAGAYGNGVYVIVRNIGTIYTSTDSTNWASQSFSFPADVGPTYTCRSITASNGTYVVTTDSGVVSSTNGSVYAAESGNNLALLSAITYGNSFVGVGYSGLIYQSSDGVAWSQRNSGTANDLNSVAAGNGLLVAVGNNGAVQTSPSGLIWTSRLSGTSLTLYGVTYSNGLYVAVGQGGTVVTSPDGINWAAQYSGEFKNLLSVTYGSAGFLAVGTNGTILTSPDGTNWTQQISGTPAGFQSATFGNGYYLIAGGNAVVMT